MAKDLTGLGDLDVEDMDRRTRDEFRMRNPDNQSEVTLEMWTLARLTRDDQRLRSVVYGIVVGCLTDDYSIGDIACSGSLFDVPQHPDRRIFVSKRLRYECKGPGSEITIREDELEGRLPNSDASTDDVKRQKEHGEL